MNLPEGLGSFLEEIGVSGSITGLQPLAQWQNPTAFRIFLDGPDTPGSLIVKHIPNFQDGSVCKPWNPRWKVAQDYVNLSFLHEVGAGQFTPKLYGYSFERNKVAIQDLGRVSLRDIEKIDMLKGNAELWCSVARRLAELVCSCPGQPQAFREVASRVLPGFAVLDRWKPKYAADTLLGLATHIDFKAIDRLESEISRLSRLVLNSNRWIGYSTGDLWHEHVMIHRNLPKFIDFHCGGYDICVTDLVRLVDGTPMYQDEPIEQELKQECKDIFLEELASRCPDGLSRSEFEQVYSFALVRQVVSMVAREIVQLKRKNMVPTVIAAIRNAARSIQSLDDISGVMVEYLTKISQTLQSERDSI